MGVGGWAGLGKKLQPGAWNTVPASFHQRGGPPPVIHCEPEAQHLILGAAEHSGQRAHKLLEVHVAVAAGVHADEEVLQKLLLRGGECCGRRVAAVEQGRAGRSWHVPAGQQAQ